VLHEMGLREYAAMTEVWTDYPPVEVLVPAYFGIKPRPTQQQQDEAIEQLLGMFGGGVIR
jgi:hypothetical protein